MVSLALAVAVLGAGLAALRPTPFRSTVDVLIKPVVGAAFSPDTTGNAQQVTVGLETESHLVGDPQVVALLGRSLRSAVDDGRVDISTTLLTNSQILAITVNGSTPARARANATAVARAYLLSRGRQATQVRDQQVSGLDKQIIATQARLAAASSASSDDKADATVQLLATRLTSLQSALGSAQAVATAPGKVVSPASVPSRFSPLSYLVGAIVGAIIGVLLGLALALRRARRFDEFDIDATSTLGVPRWGFLGDRSAKRSALLVNQDADSSSREAMRHLRMLLAAGRELPGVVAVSSREPFAPLSAIAVDLATSLADAGYDVTLVDAAIDDPRVAGLVQHPEVPGVADLLRHQRQRVLPSSAFANIQVVTAGTSPGEVRDLYSGYQLRAALDRERKKRDLVLLVTPPLSSATGISVASAADTVLLIVDRDRDRYRSIVATIEQIKRSGVAVGGLASARHLESRAAHAAQEIATTPQSSAPPIAEPGSAGDQTGIAGEPSPDAATTDAEPSEATQQTPVDAAGADAEPVPEPAGVDGEEVRAGTTEQAAGPSAPSNSSPQRATGRRSRRTDPKPTDAETSSSSSVRSWL
ncbi:hypothetical protein [Nocardioides mangrovicus]|uniref:hypothetical protein n=1 Tax=Nocardioides mangrovicus TaxID=2478913 RepID=UPI0011C34B5C|nr:hypothetical protein [Nocardioides mangrovicus]